MCAEKKTKKNKSPEYGEVSRKTAEKMRREARNLDVVVLALALIIVLSLLTCHGQQVHLEASDTEGFPMWFLLLIAYPALGVISLFHMLANVEPGGFMAALLQERPAWALGIIDLVYLAVVWAVVRFYVMKRYGAAVVRVWANFILIFLIWGSLQLAFYFSCHLWETGGFAPLHRKAESAPEKVMTKKVP